MVIYLSAVCRISAHPAARTETQQGSRAWRGTRGRGKSVAPHQGTRDGHTERQEELWSQQHWYSHTNRKYYLVADLELLIISHSLHKHTELKILLFVTSAGQTHISIMIEGSKTASIWILSWDCFVFSILLVCVDNYYKYLYVLENKYNVYVM